MTKEIFAPHQPGDDVYELNEFYELCKQEALNDYEGYGRFSNGREVSRNPNDVIAPSSAARGALWPEWATHVVWYER